jgi:hypothetical protein
MKFHGAVGYAAQEQTSPGVWQDIITERSYYGDVDRAARRLEAPLLTLNSNVVLENSISIVADAFALNNFETMRYVTWNGKRWTVTSVEIQRPRLVLTIGELWNGDTPGVPAGS